MNPTHLLLVLGVVSAAQIVCGALGMTRAALAATATSVALGVGIVMGAL